MRAFWALIVVLVAASAGVLVLRWGGAPPAVTPVSLPEPPASPAPARTPSPPVPATAPVKTIPVETPAAPAASLDSALRDAANDADVKVDLPAPPAPIAEAPEPEAAKPESNKPEVTKPTPASAPAPKPPEFSPEADPLSDNPAAALTSLPDVPNGVAITREDDGSLLLDHRFIVRGEGTAEKPYEVAWEYLVSTSETYKPRLGQKEVPGWVQLINNKHVRITGFVAFPIMAQNPDEMLVMLNQWDGCCIGVPPTPYDAVEVKLKEAVRGDDRLKTFGTVEGLFSIDPYLVKDWLIGLYTMKDAKLSNTSGAQTSPHLTKPQP